jgi:hypothetical protein
VHAIRYALIASIVLATVTGCATPPPFFKVSGKAMYKGKPLTTGVVGFHHTDAKSPLVTGQVGEDGAFQLTTKNPGDGAAPGEYMVTVTSMLPGRGVEGMDKDYRPPQPLIPLKYMRLDETPLRATVEPRNDNVVNLTLSP